MPMQSLSLPAPESALTPAIPADELDVDADVDGVGDDDVAGTEAEVDVHAELGLLAGDAPARQWGLPPQPAGHH